MNTTIEIPGLAPDVMADVQLVADCLASVEKFPPEVARRIHELAARTRQEILEKHGVQNIGVQIIRELRGELPLP